MNISYSTRCYIDLMYVRRFAACI